MGHRSWTHCVNGHEFTEENTQWKRGTRACRTCQRRWNNEADRRRRERKRLAKLEEAEMPSVTTDYAITKMRGNGSFRAECLHIYPHGAMCDWWEDTINPDFALRMLQNHMRRAHQIEGVTMRKAMSEG